MSRTKPPVAAQPVEPGGKPAKSPVLRGPDLRQDRAVRTRAHILRCAAEIFAVRGYPYTSIMDVAQRVGMTKGAVYFHFPNKESLAVAVVEELYSRWPLTLEEVRGKGLSPLDTAIEMFNQATDAFQSDPIIQAGTRLQNERAFIDADLPAPYLDWTNLISSLLREAQAMGQLRDGVAPDKAARVAVAAFFGMQHISDNLHLRADIKERWREVRDLLFLALRAQPDQR
ncbi:ScbR family autoregulator-binding transcription factor [Streptomyces sp. NBC_00847]|uniref:ScbR family autoregulator-binding transcription factor n=1 Tax=unclassified Streptomyces TaxID=2593676 RepID=UPI00224E3564|nr:ScbR family autoregulator-binding transcription factor [Streptomyces sp. NBC_00847]MCX4883159.1 ScbR family autoregulator-binding transcription factor [Streptomyces sp. NBC_00847]